jgi:uncharacterized protein (TIGR02145 family)
MKKIKTMITILGVFIFLFAYGNTSRSIDHHAGSNSNQTSLQSSQTTTKSKQSDTKATLTKSKSTQTGSKSSQTKSKATPAKAKSSEKSPESQPDIKSKDSGIVTLGTQTWAVVNLNVSTFRNGDSIPEAKTNQEWIAAGESGKPAWCYYNNDPANGPKYGRLYNWYAVNDPRELAPVGWTLSSDVDWAKLTYFLGGQGNAGSKIKSTSGWGDGNNGTNETGFTALACGYRIENGKFVNLGSISIWWSVTESNSNSAFDHYLSQNNSLNRSSSPKTRGESVRCLKN